MTTNNRHRRQRLRESNKQVRAWMAEWVDAVRNRDTSSNTTLLVMSREIYPIVRALLAAAGAPHSHIVGASYPKLEYQGEDRMVYVLVPNAALELPTLRNVENGQPF